MKASVRVHSLTLTGPGDKTLGSMELHGKRQDRSSQLRKVRDAEPLVWGTLDLRKAYDEHVEGARMNAALMRPAMHALVQFPPDLKITAKNERLMLELAVEFVNRSHGGDAVFAARLDRDEAGQHTVDVFFAPRYIKATKSREAETWISTTKHGKELCEKHRAEIERRARDGVFKTGPRQVGIALQAELYEFLGEKGLKLSPRKLKDEAAPDRVSPEAYKAQKDAEAAQARIDTLEAEVRKLRNDNFKFRNVLDAVSEFVLRHEDQLPKPIAQLFRAIERVKAQKLLTPACDEAGPRPR